MWLRPPEGLTVRTRPPTENFAGQVTGAVVIIRHFLSARFGQKVGIASHQSGSVIAEPGSTEPRPPLPSPEMAIHTAAESHRPRHPVR